MTHKTVQMHGKHALVKHFQNPAKIYYNQKKPSLPNILSEVPERLIFTKLNEEIEELNIIPYIQSGFRASHSIEQQALRLTEIILQYMQTYSSTSPTHRS